MSSVHMRGLRFRSGIALSRVTSTAADTEASSRTREKTYGAQGGNTWKVMKFKNLIFQAWKVMEFKNESVKMSEVNVKLTLMENWKNSWKKSWKVVKFEERKRLRAPYN